MDNNEIMNYDEIEIVDDAMMADEKTGISTGAAMLIGAGLTFVVGAGVKLAKKLVAAHKAKKELKKPEGEVLVDEQDIEKVVSK